MPLIRILGNGHVGELKELGLSAGTAGRNARAV